MSRRTFLGRGHALRAARASGAIVRIACAAACCPCASLSAQSLDLAQYAHTAWRVQDGAPGAVRDLAQGADGVFWIASERGLFQFDGVRFERFEPPPGQTLLPHAPHVLLALPDTSLWIGHFTAGVSVIHRGRIVTYGTEDGLPGGAVTAIARDSGGTMWAATSRGLARLVGGGGRRSTPPPGIREATPSRSSWTGAGRSGRWRKTGSTFSREGRRASRSASRPGPAAAMASWMLVAAPDGSVWAVHRSYGVFPLADGRGGPPPPRTLAYADTGIYSLTWSRDNPAVAIGTSGRLVRLWLSPLGGRGRDRRRPFRPGRSPSRSPARRA